MSKVLIIYCHPNPKSFNHAVYGRLESELKKSHEVRTRDLYALKFNPVLDGQDLGELQAGKVSADIAAEQAEILWADRLAFVYPLWWFGRPALLKGYIDRVLSYGFAFEYGPNGGRGLLHHKKALVLMTTGTPEVILGTAQNALPTSMRDGTLKFCGIQEVLWKSFDGVIAVSDADRHAMLDEIPALAKTLVS